MSFKQFDAMCDLVIKIREDDKKRAEEEQQKNKR